MFGWLIVAGRLRSFWRAVLYFVLIWYALPWALGFVATPLWNVLHLANTFNAAAIAFNELILLVPALMATGAFALYEHRRIGDYGMPFRRALGRNTWEGFAVGLVMAGLVGVGMWALGGLRIGGFAVAGAPLLIHATAWLMACIMIGIAEEFAFRGYLLCAFWRDLGFWPAAVLAAAVFVALHYFYKPGENLRDVVTLAGLALLLCDTLRRTGTLWFAVGFHVAFDFTQLFVIGTPNGGQIPVGRLLAVTFTGKDWLTGGSLGTEASVLMYPVIALAWLYVAWRYRNIRAFRPPGDAQA